MNYKSQRGNALVAWIIIIGLIWGISVLFSGEDDYSSNNYEYSPSYTDLDYRSPTRYYDDSYEYNYRSGYSGRYEYNYDVEGYGDDGYVYGTVDTSGKYGEGYIYDEYGNELWVETEWTDYGVLEAYDENGNWYELETY